MTSRANHLNRIARSIFGLLPMGLLSVALMVGLLAPRPAHSGGSFPVPPILTVQLPTDGDHVTSVFSAHLIQTFPTAIAATVRKNDLILWQGLVGFGLTEFHVNSELLPNGEHDLTVELSSATQILATATLTVNVLNPDLYAELPNNITANQPQVQITLSGLQDGDIYVALAGDRLIDSWFSQYQMTLPLFFPSTETLMLGIHDGANGNHTVTETHNLGNLANAPQVFFLLLTYNAESGWKVSRTYSIDL